MNSILMRGMWFWVLLPITVFTSACDPIYRTTVGPLRLNVTDVPKQIIRIGGVESVAPVLTQIQLRRPPGGPAADVVVFASLEPPKEFERIHPEPLEAMQKRGLKVRPNGEVEELGRFVCFAKWAAQQTEIVCAQVDLPVLQNEWFLYAVASPAPPWLDMILNFERLGMNEPPPVSVHHLDVLKQ